MAYSLEDAAEELKRSTLWNSEPVMFEPLIGPFDGSNRVFRTKGKPITSLTLYQTGGSAQHCGSYTEFATEGVVVFDTAPVSGSQVLASYSVVEFTDTQLQDFARDGFDRMMAEYPRSWYLVNSSGSTYISSESATVVDPVIIGDTSFSESRRQIGLLVLCSLYRMTLARQIRASAIGMSYRESLVGGVQVDNRARGPNLDQAIDRLEKDIERAAEAAEEETEGVGAYGVYHPGARSNDYMSNFEWWEGSDQEMGSID